MTQSKINELIIKYYNTCESDYRLLWDLDRSLAMHAGFWDNQTHSLTDALKRENEILAEYAHIKNSDRVLDAGCGIGGSSIFLAKQFGCEVTGITLSSQQVDKANIHAKEHGVAHRATFQVMDFCETNFPDASFDVIWGIESICHAQDKLKFIKEAFRLLKPAGRLVVADGFNSKNQQTSVELLEMEQWLYGWGVNRLDSRESFHKNLIQSNFKNITYNNVTSLVMPSSKRLYWISLPAISLSKIGEFFGLRTKMQTQNVRAAYFQHTTLKKGLWEYGIFLAHKN